MLVLELSDRWLLFPAAFEAWLLGSQCTVIQRKMLAFSLQE